MKALILILAIFSCHLDAATIFTYMSSESKNDSRQEYERDLLELALSKTLTEFGEFELKPSDPGLNLKRLFKLSEIGYYENFFFKTSASDILAKKFDYVNFPLERGIVGYRIAIINKLNSDKYKLARGVPDLVCCHIVQGVGWLDTDILKINRLNVFEISNYDRMFQMIERKRSDLFFRGVNEISSEMQTYQKINPNLMIEPHIALHYPLPRFFFTAKGNTQNIKRIELGLKRAYQDGSLIKLWREYYLESVIQAELDKRHIIELENPFIKSFNQDYTQYNFSFDEIRTKPDFSAD